METLIFMILLQPGFSTKLSDTGVVERQIRRLITCGLQANEVLVPDFCYEYNTLILNLSNFYFISKFPFDKTVF